MTWLVNDIQIIIYGIWDSFEFLHQLMAHWHSDDEKKPTKQIKNVNICLVLKPAVDQNLSPRIN